jgi:hypothetical protein
MEMSGFHLVATGLSFCMNDLRRLVLTIMVVSERWREGKPEGSVILLSKLFLVEG